MNELEMERLVESVLQRVLSSMGTTPAAPSCDEGKPRYLVIGNPDGVPGKLQGQAVLIPGDEAACANILRYQKVIIEHLELIQLVDIAQGRPSDAACCAVLQALLNGIEVVLLETALPHRAYAGKSSTGLYALLEGYVRSIQAFGVKLLTRERMAEPAVKPVRPPKYQAPPPAPAATSAKPNAERLITESIALSMAAAAEGTVCIAPDAILTPSARDVFAAARLTVTRGQG